ncbi:MAG: T9SS type A sorting domain-containing protein [Agriterribacter sp.]
MVRTFTLTFLLGVLIHFSGFSQEKLLAVNKDAATFKIVKFYPNPATTIITFELQKGKENSYNLQIYNFLGKKVLEIKNTQSSNQVNLNDFDRGVYIFQLRDPNGKIIESGKFQVSK